MQEDNIFKNIDLDIKEYNGFIDFHLNVEKTTNKCIFEFVFNDILEPEKVYNLLISLRNKFTINELNNDVRLNIKFNNKNNIDYTGYFKLAIKIISLYVSKIKVLNSVKFELDNDLFKFYINPEDIQNKDKLLKQVDKCLKTLDIDFKYKIVECNETPSIAISLKQQTPEPTKNMVTYVNNDTKKGFVPKQAINDKRPTTMIKSLDMSKEHLKQLEKNKQNQFVFIGEIMNILTRKTKKGNDMYNFSLYDGSDSLACVYFCKAKEDISDIMKENAYVRMVAEVKFDDVYSRQPQATVRKIYTMPRTEKESRTDNSTSKRVELKVHSKYSTLNGINSIEDLVKQASKWEHSAIALTDIENVHGFPEFSYAAKSNKIKPIYGVSTSLVDRDKFKINFTDTKRELTDSTFIIFDIETTGFSVNFDEIIEIGAVKIKGNIITERFSKFVKPNRDIPSFITELTSITNNDVKKADTIDIVMKEFIDFCDDGILVAHNADFDMGHIYENMKKLKIDKVFDCIDSLDLVRALYIDDPKIKLYNLKSMSKFFGVKLDNHHRAVDDSEATALCFFHILDELSLRKVTCYSKLNELYNNNEYKFKIGGDITLLAKNKKGLKNLYKIVSESHTNTFARGAKVYKDYLDEHRDNILVGSGSLFSDTFEYALNKSYEELYDHLKYFDYVEIQPFNCLEHIAKNYYEDTINIYTEIEEAVLKIISAAKDLNKIIVATGDVYHIEKEHLDYRKIYIKSKGVGGSRNPLWRDKELPSQYFLTTDEMLEAFPYINPDDVKDYVIRNTNKIADMIEEFNLFPKELFTPKDDFLKDRNIPSMKEELINIINKTVESKYGKSPHKLIKDRLEKELESIIGNKFSSIYYISHLLVKNSLDNGYVVGSRGSVGSSFAATMSNITEVNPLPPHYVCPKCKFTSFKLNDTNKVLYPLTEKEEHLQKYLLDADCGFDLAHQFCPDCETLLSKDGHDIPFEVFLGFDGTKVPDIDLNFSGVYQPVAHEFAREMFGYDFAYRAGTIGTVKEKTAFGYVLNYYEENGIDISKAEVSRQSNYLVKVKRTTGQHPGGIIVVPDYMDIYDITPVQYPSDTPGPWKTTHFDYHSFESNLLKLDILGHDDPTILRSLMDFVDESPDEFPFNSVEGIPLDDPSVLSLYNSVETLGITDELFLKRISVGTIGLPESSTDYVREMLKDIRPSKFSDLVKISGLSHGTDVWLGNAKDLVLGTKKEFKKVDFKEVIGCRDDIMVYLMYHGIDPTLAFNIMEFVRKGKPSKDKNKWEEYKGILKSHNIEDWYIYSCEKIKYMFPKAHATAYVLKAIRMGWFKVHRPKYFYTAYFSSRATQMDAAVMARGIKAVKLKIDEIDKLGNKASNVEKDLLTVLFATLEMNLRGINFNQIDITRSEATTFKVDGDNILLPLTALKGFGEIAATKLVKSREERPFTSIEDVLSRKLINKNIEKGLIEIDGFGTLEEKENNSLFKEE